MRWYSGLLAAACLLLAGAGWAASYHYTGSIGDRTAVQMDLARQGTSLTGTYWYDSVGLPLKLTGRARRGTATVKEFDENGTQTGAFTGALSRNDRQIRGVWRSPDGQRRLPFAFTANAAYRTLTVTRRRYDVKGTYPAFLSTAPGWRALSSLLYGQVTTAQQDFLKETAGGTLNVPGTRFTQYYDIGVAYADDNLASLLTQEFTFTGGAHPNTVYTSVNYQVAGNTPRLLGLNDLFAPDSGYLDAIFQMVLANLNQQKKQRGGIPVWDTFSTKDLNVYTLSPRSITFVFSPYVAGPYAEGTYYVAIPYSQLTQYLNPKGPLAKFVAPATSTAPADEAE